MQGIGDAIWTARRVYRHKREVRRMLDPRSYERHGRSRWIPDATITRRVELAQVIAFVIAFSAFVAASVAWCLGVI